MPAEPETVALYVADLRRRGRRPATIARKLAAIAVYYRSAGHHNPEEHDVVRAVVRGTRRELSVSQRQSTTLTLDGLTRVLAAIPGDTRGLRDRALLIVGWAAAPLKNGSRRCRRHCRDRRGIFNTGSHRPIANRRSERSSTTSRTMH
jgi:site-specific recombinase XerC